ncbi:hypothetical protein M501DRAFT_919057, partial [Patellaria atrata CBS 101060]
FNRPGRGNHVCSPEQNHGYDWGNLPTGPFNHYGGSDFSGFSCGNRFGRRDDLSKRTFQPRCITGKITQNDNGPRISCGSKPDFSIDEFELSVDLDNVEVELHYGMADGSVCRQTTNCQRGGTVVKNRQCGGAKT